MAVIAALAFILILLTFRRFGKKKFVSRHERGTETQDEARNKDPLADAALIA